MFLTASRNHGGNSIGGGADLVYGEEGDKQALPEADRELVDGLKRFSNSRLGKEVKEICVSQ